MGGLENEVNLGFLKPFFRMSHNFTQKVEKNRMGRFGKMFKFVQEGQDDEQLIEIFDVVIKSKSRL